MWIWILNITLLFVVIYHASGLSDLDPLVDSKVGFIRGLRATDGDYSMYLGIPYATVNKSNPFGVSAPHPKFMEVFEAFNDSAICPQVEEFNNTIVGTLDCLHVNIYVPDSANSSNLLPVLVYIYGGLFMIGFSGRYLYGARYLVKHDIILVTFNYRLGPYGFMCLNTPEVPGNQGLKDQQLAFKWIKNNIEAFGGDSNKITICGSSSGASSADFHLLYSNEQLFHQAILQSGTALHPWAMLQPDTSAPQKLSKQLGFTATNTHEALAFLSTVDSNLMTEAVSELGLKFRPCVEKDFGKVEKFIYDYPVNIQKPSLGNVPILLGCNSDEALAAYDNLTPKDFTNLNEFIINRVTTLWANFVKFGDPTPETTDLLPVKWSIVTKDNMYYLTIDMKLKLKKRNFKARMTFWDLLYKLNQKAQVGYREDTDQNTCAAIPNNYKEYFGNY
ncbi:hypothetical protein PYW08_006893 [Mythimna loreyi]|uniref:Uncharacterized protein n=1 Tax=Mythimna loreyi TaxID=667449 RepID=A0ACC2R8S9_9NEOP|nr:hypothetical protein PYW08_006893 [Mythimna loreyi]